MRTRLSATELRQELKAVLAAVADGEVFEVGAYRVPVAVVLGVNEYERHAPPSDVMDALMRAAALAAAADYLDEKNAAERSVYPYVDPGHEFTQLVRWLWSTGQEDRAARVVHELARLVGDHPDADSATDPPAPRPTPELVILGIADKSRWRGMSQEQTEALAEFLGERLLGRALKAPSNGWSKS